MHEAAFHENNCFVTLTYARGCVPPDGSLEYRDFQLFMKRLRKKFWSRFYMCGEYGPLNKRPHYHACLFGIDFLDRVYDSKSQSGYKIYTSETLTELWGHGKATVQDMVRETAGYCARYIMKKQLGTKERLLDEWIDEDGVVRGRIPEFSGMSLKPGIGEQWFKMFYRDVFPHDFVIAEGVKRPVPKYYDKLHKRMKADRDKLEYLREQRAKEGASDQTEERRLVREIVHNAKVSTLARGDLE